MTKGDLALEKNLERMGKEMEKDMREQQRIAASLLRRDPSLGITAYIVAGEMLSAKRARQLMQDTGKTALEVYPFIGSYARFQFLVEQTNKGNISRPEFYKLLPQEWCSCDPDDTKKEYRSLWFAAWLFNHKKPLLYGDPLPPGKVFTVYRGQDAKRAVGISWTLDRAIAEKFAAGMGLRQKDRGGKVLEALVDRVNIYAYLTKRGEAEVIADPRSMRSLR